MVTIYKIENTMILPDKEVIFAELRGLSTDTKPITIGDKVIGNGSSYIATDTQKLYFFDADSQEWNEQQIESIDWAISQNSDKNSPYYNKIDVNNIAAAGMSCGGLQTLFNCADKRIKTLMICNSGLFINPINGMPKMPMPTKEKLKEIKVPVIYILGGESDIAYENGMDDFHRINHVPAFAANYPVGHGGTYREAHGGEFSIIATAWLNWQLKNDKNAALWFQGENCLLSQREKWTVEKNDKIDK